MDDLDVNMAIGGIFLNTTLRAAVHLGQDCEASLRYVKNQLWSSVKQLFNETGKLIRGQPAPSRGTQSQTVRAERRIISYYDEVHRTLPEQHIRHCMS